MSLMEIARGTSRDNDGVSLLRLRGYSAVAALIATISIGYIVLGSAIHSLVQSM